MTDCDVPSEFLNLSDSDKLSKISHPTHLLELGAKVSSIKQPPNGMTHVSPDSNGLIKGHESHVKTTDETDHSLLFNKESSWVSVQEDACESLNSLGDICDCNKSNNVDICELASSLHNVCLDQIEPAGKDVLDGIEYVVYKSELQMPDIMRLITKDLSEPYSIYTYRYFIHNWPKLCFLVSILLLRLSYASDVDYHV